MRSDPAAGRLCPLFETPVLEIGWKLCAQAIAGCVPASIREKHAKKPQPVTGLEANLESPAFPRGNHEERPT